jgi:uncharacterized protein (DUF58 family)
MMVGAYLSHFKGRGMDFEELREYIPGDDVRDIDWNVTHRMGRPFVKRFREERELAAVLAVDVSASSAFGSGNRTKREFAAEVAATLAISAARNGDKVALLLFTEKAELFIPPRKGRRQILRLVREMLTFQPKHRGTDIPAALTFLNHIGAPLSFLSPISCTVSERLKWPTAGRLVLDCGGKRSATPFWKTRPEKRYRRCALPAQSRTPPARAKSSRNLA